MCKEQKITQVNYPGKDRSEIESTPAAENRVELAIFFAKNGSLKAFQYLGDEYLKSRNRSSLRKFLMLSPCRVDEFPDWYRRNRDELVFDPARRCFLIPGNDP